MYYAQFNESYPPQTDGVAQTTRNYAVWLNRKYGPCCVVAPQHPMSDDHEEFQVFRFASMPLFITKDYKLGLPEIAFKTYHKLDTLPLDIVHAHCPFTSGTLALMVARKKNIPLVATFHTKFADDFAQRLKMENAGKIAARYTSKYFSQADEVWAANGSSEQTLREYGYRGPITIMPNGCDILPMERTSENRQKVLNQFHLSDKPLLLFVGRLVEQKNVGFLLKAFSMINDLDCNLLLVGDSASKPAYQKMAKELGIANRVKFAGSINDRDTLRCIYAASDLFTLPSVYDTDGLVKREAAACGCPSALITGSNAAEEIIHGVNGFTSELDQKAYSMMLKQVLSNHDLMRKAGESARNTVYVSWESVVDRVANEYKRIITDFTEKKAINSKPRPYYPIPAVFAREIINRQTVRIKFTTRNLDRKSRLRTATIQKKSLKRIRDIRSRLLEGIHRRDL